MSVDETNKSTTNVTKTKQPRIRTDRVRRLEKETEKQIIVPPTTQK